MNALNRFAPAVLSLLRIASAYMFILHGTAKFFSFPVSMGGGSPSGIYLAAAILEVGGGLLLLLGLLTRPVAFILSGQMAVAYFMAHAAESPLFPIANGGESAALLQGLVRHIGLLIGNAICTKDCPATTHRRPLRRNRETGS